MRIDIPQLHKPQRKMPTKPAKLGESKFAKALRLISEKYRAAD